jgi:hypothetical protein
MGCGRRNRAGVHGRGRQIHGHKSHPADGRSLPPGDRLRVQWRLWQGFGNVVYGATTRTTRCTPMILSTAWAKPTTPKFTVDGDTWIWLSETRMDPQTMKRTTHDIDALGHRLQLQLRSVRRWRHLEYRTGRQRYKEIDCSRLSRIRLF